MNKIATLSARWLTLKQAERDAAESRKAVEAELLALVDSKEGGSKTTKEAGYKITVKRPVYRSLDGDAWHAISDRIPYEVWPVKMRLEADDKGCQWLRENRPDLWAIAAEAITEKPGSAGFVIVKEGDE
jgi:hypothetical protein